MVAIKIKTRLESDTLVLPQLRHLIGKTVEIRVTVKAESAIDRMLDTELHAECEADTSPVPTLDEVRAVNAAGPSAALQPGAESWVQAYVASGDLAEEIATLKAQEGKPIIAHGGVSFARSLVVHGLVDQFALFVAPVALGKGQPLFSELTAPMPLKLMSSKAFPGGAVAQIYRPA